MKRLSVLLCLMMLTGTLGAQPQLRFDVRSADMGDVSEGGKPVSAEFRFRNTGDRPLVVLKAETTCTCTKVNYTKQPVLPGKEGAVTVVYNPRKQSGAFRKAIRIYVNTDEKQYILTVTGSVVP